MQRSTKTDIFNKNKHEIEKENMERGKLMDESRQKKERKRSYTLYDIEDKAKGQSSRNAKRKEEGEREQGLK